eukprot:3371519-Pyramimonas_sp.AAC.1
MIMRAPMGAHPNCAPPPAGARTPRTPHDGASPWRWRGLRALCRGRCGFDRRRLRRRDAGGLRAPAPIGSMVGIRPHAPSRGHRPWARAVSTSRVRDLCQPPAGCTRRPLPTNCLLYTSPSPRDRSLS